MRRKIWSETEPITRPTGRGSGGGSGAKARTRKTYVGVKDVTGKVLVSGEVGGNQPLAGTGAQKAWTDVSGQMENMLKTG